ncbi:hypothetical protein KQX54_013928 [Cotesia glomerata]|uniref:Uncharacterized protein n=1 Tax=Cotesia glomerata TaxID=32391 RepID=A0AAV7IFC2_COTGL|nr:hypothetical protein KQX54_013928 [Cotesia glomerata]
MAFTMNGAPQTQNNYQRKPFQPFSAQGQYRTPYRAYGNRPYQTSYHQGGIYQPYRPQNFPSYPSQLHPPPAAPREQQMFQTYPQMTSKSLPTNPVTEAINPQSPEEDQEPAPIQTLLLPANGTDPGAPQKKRGRPLGSRTKRVQSLPVIRDTIASRLRSELRRGSQNPPVVYRESEPTDNRTEGDTPDDLDDVFLPPNGNGGKSGRIEPPKDPIQELAPATYFDSDDDGDDDEEEGGGKPITSSSQDLPAEITYKNIDSSRTSVNESIKKFERIAKKFGNVKGVAPPWIRGTTKPTYPLPADPLWVPFTKTPPNKQVIREVRKSINEPFHQLNITSNDEEDQIITAPNNLEHDTDTTEHENEITELLDEENNIENDNTSTASEPDDTVIPTETNEPSLPKSLTATEENIRLVPETPTLIRTMLNNFETQGIHWDPSSGKIVDTSTYQGSTPYRPFIDETVIAQRRNRLSELPTFNTDDNPDACSSVIEDHVALSNQITPVPKARKRVTFGEKSTSERSR